VTEGITKNHDAVYVLGTGIKKEKVDGGDVKRRGDGDKRKRGGPGDAEVQKEDEGVQAKRVRFGGSEMKNKGGVGNDKGGGEEEEVEDGLSSDSDEEED
jgi:hypothetical protein